MKVNYSSWHFNVMAFFKWSRHYYNNYDLDRSFSSWRIFDAEVGAADHSFPTYKRYMKETGNFLPLDFCSYWRCVLLWPLMYVAYWAICLTLSAIALSYVTLAGTGFVLITLLTGVLICAFVLGVNFIASLVKSKVKTFDKDSFFKNVKKAIHTPDFCSLMEYEDKKEETSNA